MFGTDPTKPLRVRIFWQRFVRGLITIKFGKVSLKFDVVYVFCELVRME